MFVHSAETRAAARRLFDRGLSDAEVGHHLGLSRRTVGYWRDLAEWPVCPRCWRRAKPLEFTSRDYAELLGLYLGDGYINAMPRTYRFRLFLDSKHTGVVRDAKDLLTRCFPHGRIQVQTSHEGRMTILGTYSSHLPCLFPQHGTGMKHQRRVALEGWQRLHVQQAPWAFLRGCIRSDGCVFVNRTGRYEYVSYDFANLSQDLLTLFGDACDLVGVEYRRYPKRIRIYRRESVAMLLANVGEKR